MQYLQIDWNVRITWDQNPRDLPSHLYSKKKLLLIHYDGYDKSKRLNSSQFVFVLGDAQPQSQDTC